MNKTLMTVTLASLLPFSQANATGVQEEMCSIFEEYYGLSERKQVDWQTECYNKDVGRNNVQIFKRVFTPLMEDVLKDGHTSIDYRDQFATYEPNLSEYANKVLTKVNPSLISYKIKPSHNRYLAYGTLKQDPSIGYINSFNFEPEGELEEDYDLFVDLVDQALHDLKDKKAIVIDVRLNLGGQIPLAHYLAGQFIKQDSVHVARYRVRNEDGQLTDWLSEEFMGYKDRRADGGYVAGVLPEDGYFHRATDHPYTKPVVVLTSEMTASSGEFFTAAMNTLPNVTILGSTTFGIFAGSDILTLRSNPDFRVRLSVHDVEIQQDGQFISLEGKGITPDVRHELSPVDAEKGFDSQLAKAIKLLNQ